MSRWRTWLTLAEYTDAAITSERWVSALIRKRSLVRVQAGPPSGNRQFAGKTQERRCAPDLLWSLCAATVQQRGEPPAILTSISFRLELWNHDDVSPRRWHSSPRGSPSRILAPLPPSIRCYVSLFTTPISCERSLAPGLVNAALLLAMGPKLCKVLDTNFREFLF